MAEEFEKQLEAMEQLDAIRLELRTSADLRAENGPPKLRGHREKCDKECSSLVSNLKKCSAFAKKLRVITPDGLTQCIRDVDVLNLNPYIEEIVSGILESNFKSTDVPALVKLSVKMHQRYASFTEPLLSGIRTSLFEDSDEGSKRRRIHLRFLIELFHAGVMRDEEFFLQLLRHLLGRSPVDGGKAGLDVAGFVTFVKYAAEPLLGRMSKKTLALLAAAGSSEDDIGKSGLGPGITTPRMSQELGLLVTDAAENMCMDLVKAFAEFKDYEKTSEKYTAIHGSLTEKKQQELDSHRKLYEKLLSAVTSITECLNMEMPVLKEKAEVDDRGSAGLSVWDGSSVSLDFGPFGDADSKYFYDELPDLLAMVPLTVLGLTSEQAAAKREEWQKRKENAFLPGETDESAEVVDETEEGNKDAFVEPSQEDSNAPREEDIADDADADVSTESGTTAFRLKVLLTEKLPECNSRQKADDFASSFCYLNSKKARKSLIEHLSRIPKGRTELIPQYARIIASLSRLFNDIAAPILESVYGCFIGKFKSKHQFDFDGKSRNIRYVGELVKFSIAPPIMAFRIFNKLFSDFTNQNVLLCAFLMETCGRFLYLLPHTFDRMNSILDSVLRLRRAKHLDSNCQMALEAAYFSVKPPERKEFRKKKELSKLQMYIRHLFAAKLSDSPGAVDKVIRELRKLPWSNREENVEFHVLKGCFRVVKTKYISIPLVADAIAGLVRYHPKLQVGLVDMMTEDFLRGMDAPHKREPQRMLGLARLLGECYNYSIINSTVVFDFLYLFLNYGHEVSSAVSQSASIRSNTLEELLAAISISKGETGKGVDKSEGAFSSSSVPLPRLAGEMLRQFHHSYDCLVKSDKDLPTDGFRAQLVAEVLRCCGAYFVVGVLRDRLSRFLLHFQRYLLCKMYIPMHIEFTILELFDELESLAAAATLRELRVKKPSKGKLVSAPNMKTMTLIFPRYDSFEAVQEEITLRYGDDNAECCDAIDEAEEEEEGGERQGEAQDELPDDVNEDDIALPDEDDKDPECDDSELSESNAAQLMSKLRQQEEEDEDFERAFRSAMLESVSSAQRSDALGVSTGTARATGVDRLALPAVLPKPKNVFVRGNDESDESDSDDDEGSSRPQSPKVKFKLLSRDRKGRFETREFEISKDAEMVARLEKLGEQKRLEKQKLKEKVLLYEEGSAIQKKNIPVEYLGGKDHFSGAKKQIHIASSKYQQKSKDTTSLSNASPANASTAPTTKSLNLGDFLSESSKAEVRKFQNDIRGGASSR